MVEQDAGKEAARAAAVASIDAAQSLAVDRYTVDGKVVQIDGRTSAALHVESKAGYSIVVVPMAFAQALRVGDMVRYSVTRLEPLPDATGAHKPGTCRPMCGACERLMWERKL